jgi:hypothetical protein
VSESIDAGFKQHARVPMTTKIGPTVAVLVLAASSHASAQRASEEPLPARLPLMQTTIVEYRWSFLAPEWVVEPQTVTARVYAPSMHTQRIGYALPEWTSERRKVARVADFTCKYSDLMLPNACRTTWHDVYMDVPVPVLRRDSLEVDVPQWSWQDVTTTVDVARLVWKEQTLIVSLPAVALEHGAR